MSEDEELIGRGGDDTVDAAVVRCWGAEGRVEGPDKAPAENQGAPRKDEGRDNCRGRLAAGRGPPSSLITLRTPREGRGTGTDPQEASRRTESKPVEWPPRRPFPRPSPPSSRPSGVLPGYLQAPCLAPRLAPRLPSSVRPLHLPYHPHLFRSILRPRSSRPPLVTRPRGTQI